MAQLLPPERPITWLMKLPRLPPAAARPLSAKDAGWALGSWSLRARARGGEPSPSSTACSTPGPPVHRAAHGVLPSSTEQRPFGSHSRLRAWLGVCGTRLGGCVFVGSPACLCCGKRHSAWPAAMGSLRASSPQLLLVVLLAAACWGRAGARLLLISLCIRAHVHQLRGVEGGFWRGRAGCCPGWAAGLGVLVGHMLLCDPLSAVQPLQLPGSWPLSSWPCSSLSLLWLLRQCSLPARALLALGSLASVCPTQACRATCKAAPGSG